MDGTRSFLNSQTIRDATITPSLRHKAYSGPEPSNVENQGEREEETHIVKHKAFSVEYFYICVHEFSQLKVGSHNLQTARFTQQKSLLFIIYIVNIKNFMVHRITKEN